MQNLYKCSCYAIWLHKRWPKSPSLTYAVIFSLFYAPICSQVSLCWNWPVWFAGCVSANNHSMLEYFSLHSVCSFALNVAKGCILKYGVITIPLGILASDRSMVQWVALYTRAAKSMGIGNGDVWYYIIITSFSWKALLDWLEPALEIRVFYWSLHCALIHALNPCVGNWTHKYRAM